jgi:hypothetical protein
LAAIRSAFFFFFSSLLSCLNFLFTYNKQQT